MIMKVNLIWGHIVQPYVVCTVNPFQFFKLGSKPLWARLFCTWIDNRLTSITIDTYCKF